MSAYDVTMHGRANEAFCIGQHNWICRRVAGCRLACMALVGNGKTCIQPLVVSPSLVSIDGGWAGLAC